MDWIADPLVKIFIEEVKDLRFVWTLSNERGFFLNRFQGGPSESFPIWSDIERAKKSAVGDWEGTEPACVDIAEFLSDWVPMLIKDGLPFDVNSTPELLGPLVKPEVFLRLLGKEI